MRQIPNGLNPAEGEVRYTFDQRNLLVQIENHEGSSYQVQAEVMYDGSGNRLRTIAYVAGVPMTTTYTLDIVGGGLPLVADNGITGTLYLYGLFGIGEYDREWRYYLGDAQLSVRQLLDDSGNILMARTYDPFGLLLRQAGAGDPLYGYTGSLSGGGGLLYFSGRYFDPVTGRFLSPDNDFDPLPPSRNLNGYIISIILSNPGILLFGPLLILSRRRRRKGIDPTTWLLLGLMLTLGLAGCDEPVLPPPPTSIPPPLPPPALSPTTQPCTNGYETLACPRHPQWNGHKRSMQTRLDRITLTVANRTDSSRQHITYAPETEVLRSNRSILPPAEAAVPTTTPMYQAMSRAGERVVQAIERHVTQDDSNRLLLSCNDIAGLTLDIGGLVGTEPGFDIDYATYKNVLQGSDYPVAEVVLFPLPFEPSEAPFIGHTALVAYPHSTDPLQTIIVQSDGNAIASGIFFIHVKDSPHYNQDPGFQPIFVVKR